MNRRNLIAAYPLNMSCRMCYLWPRQYCKLKKEVSNIFILGFFHKNLDFHVLFKNQMMSTKRPTFLPDKHRLELWHCTLLKGLGCSTLP
jgi:hypothetical protein